MQTKPKRKSNTGCSCLALIVLVLIGYARIRQQDSPSGRATQTANAIARASLPPMSYSAAEYTAALSSGVGILAGGRTLVDIIVTDGRENGGERGAMIAYVSTETSDGAKVDEMFDIFDAVAATINTNRLDLDSVTLAEGNARGIVIQTITAEVDDLMDWYRREITESRFMNRLTFVDF